MSRLLPYDEAMVIAHEIRLEQKRRQPQLPTPLLTYLGGDTDPQTLWEDLKVEIKRVMRSFGRHQASWRKLQLIRLSKKRDRLLDPLRLPPGCRIHPRLPVVEAHIGNIQKEMADIQALKARKHWRENGEKSAG